MIGPSEDHTSKPIYPRLRDLPAVERAAFADWLNGQTCPWIDGLPIEEQDSYYPWDYDSWKRKNSKVR